MLRLFSETRWTVRASSLTSIYENCKVRGTLEGAYINTKIEKQRHGFMMYNLKCKCLSIFLD